MAEIREYEVELYVFRGDGSFDYSTTRTVRAYTAADAITQMSVNTPHTRVVAVRPSEKLPKEPRRG